MAKPKQDKMPIISDLTPSSVMRSSVCTFLASKDIKTMQVQTELGIISLTRRTDEKGSCTAIGFNADIDDEDDDYDVDDVIAKYWG